MESLGRVPPQEFALSVGAATPDSIHKPDALAYGTRQICLSVAHQARSKRVLASSIAASALILPVLTERAINQVTLRP